MQVFEIASAFAEMDDNEEMLCHLGSVVELGKLVLEHEQSDGRRVVRYYDMEKDARMADDLNSAIKSHKIKTLPLITIGGARWRAVRPSGWAAAAISWQDMEEKEVVVERRHKFGF